MSASALEAWVPVVSALLVAAAAAYRYVGYRKKLDRMASVGEAFSATVESLASDNQIKRMAAAVLLRRFFDSRTEQGEAGTPYLREAIEVIAGVLRETKPGQLQKVLADGLRYAHDLSGADLQRCNLHNAFLGRRAGDEAGLNLSGADLFEAICPDASFRGVVARSAVFYRATLTGAVFIDADVEDADFRAASLSGARFFGARIGGARFDGALDVPKELADALGGRTAALPGVIVGRRTDEL